MNEFVKIVEVGPRDGLQNEKTPLTLDDRRKLILDLMQTGPVPLKWVLASLQSGSHKWHKVTNSLPAYPKIRISFLVD